jgi:hypothetical protein
MILIEILLCLLKFKYMPLHSRKVRRINYIHSRVRPKSGDKIQSLYKRAEKIQTAMQKESTLYLQKESQKIVKSFNKHNIKYTFS